MNCSHQSSYYRIKWYGRRGRFDNLGINQGLAAALRVPPSGLLIALVIQIPAVTALAEGACHVGSRESGEEGLTFSQDI